MAEPKRCNDVDALVPYVASRVRTVLARMEARGFDPVVFETKRSLDRQLWLYAQGRTRKGPKITWTLTSKHITGKAVDIISRSRGWYWAAFFDALRVEGEKVGLHTIPKEGCHLEWRG